MEWLEGNLELAYPFDDQVVDPDPAVFADALVSCGVVGPYTLTIFDPLSLTDAHVQIKQGSTTLLDTTTATVTVMGDYTVLDGHDTTTDARYRFVLSTAALPTFPGFVGTAEFDTAACAFNGGVVSTLNGLSGDVIVTFPDHSDLTIADQTVSVGFADPVDRVDCSAADCAKIFSINGLTADTFGSFTISPDGCYRLVPHPEDAAKLLLFNLCDPCLDCDNVMQLDAKFASQASYYHHLAAIYHDQFNRFQRSVAGANQEIIRALARSVSNSGGSGLVTSQGVVDISGRSFNRPYFSQLGLAIVNATPYHVTVGLTVTITPSGVSNQLTYLPESAVLQRFQITGNQFTDLTDLPGTVSITLAPQEQVAVSTEVQRTTVDDAAATVGNWHVAAAVSFTSGPSPLPSGATLLRNYPVELKAGT